MEANEEKKSLGVIAYLSSLTPMQIADDERVKNKFITLYEAVHGGNGTAFYENERHYFLKLVAENKDLKSCTQLSLYGAFIDCAANDMSFDPSRQLAYLMWDNVNVGTSQNPVFEKRAKFVIQARGELALRIRYGQIKSADIPEVVYEGEHFTKITSKAGTIVEHNITYPRKKGKIIAAYIRLIKPDNSIDFFVMDTIQMDRLKQYSHKKNNGHPNKLYGEGDKDMDTGFLTTKTIKHAFKVYPKIKPKGNFSVMETELEEDPVDNINYDDLTDEGNKHEYHQEPSPVTHTDVKSEEPPIHGAEQIPPVEEVKPVKERTLDF